MTKQNDSMDINDSHLFQRNFNRANPKRPNQSAENKETRQSESTETSETAALPHEYRLSCLLNIADKILALLFGGPRFRGDTKSTL